MAQVPYQEFPTVESGGGGGTANTARANAGDFGGQIGQSEEKLGATAQHVGGEVMDQATQFARMATESKANDVLANQWAPQAAKLRANYDSLRGPDKVAGYDNYINSLQQAHQQLIGSATSPYEKQILGGYVARHISSETDAARRELVESQKQFSDQSTADMIIAQNGYAASNYNNSQVIDSTINQNTAQITKNLIDKDIDPNSEQGKSAIEEAVRVATGSMATSMVTRAVAAGDVSTAVNIRSKFSTVIPGYQQLHLDDMLHQQSIQQTGNISVAAITSGKPIPQPIGAPPIHVQAVVANTAHAAGIDPNVALTVARIESNMGQNVGTRGDIGQTGKGGDLQEQAQNMVIELKKSQIIATNVLGRSSDAWEGYVVYQQGAGGGPALLKAAQSDPNALAVDVLKPLYKNPNMALSAIVSNGGNATMSASDFVNFIQKKYTANAARAECQFPSTQNQNPIPEGGIPPADGEQNFSQIVNSEASNSTNSTILGQTPSEQAPPQKLPGDAIIEAHQTPGVAVQPAATPMGALMNFDAKAPQMLEQINAIPNYEVRQGVMRAFQQRREIITAAASAYKANLVNQAGQLAVKPDFTSMDQVPPEMHAALVTDSPQTLTYLQTRAEHNLMQGAGAVTKDMREYGTGFYDLFKSIHSTSNDPAHINSIEQLQSHVGKDGDITIAGYDKLAKELQGKGTPEGDAEGLMKKQFLAVAKSQISGADEGLHAKDPKGEELYLGFLAQALPAYEDGKSKGKTAAQLLAPDSPEYIGKLIASFRRPADQWYSDMVESATAGASANDKNTKIDISTPQGIIQAVQLGKMTLAEAEALAIRRGYARVGGPQVPVGDK